MNVGRTIFALLIALSVAMLPAAGGVSAAVKSTEMADMSGMDDMDCCPQKANPCDKAMDGCSSMATCALRVLPVLRDSIFGHYFYIARCGLEPGLRGKHVQLPKG